MQSSSQIVTINKPTPSFLCRSDGLSVTQTTVWQHCLIWNYKLIKAYVHASCISVNILCNRSMHYLVLNEETSFAISSSRLATNGLTKVYTVVPCGHCLGYLMYETVLLTSDHTVIRSCNSRNVTHTQLLLLVSFNRMCKTPSLFPFSALTLLIGWQEGHPACKTSGVRLLVVTFWLELCTSYSSSSHHHLHHP